jgi:hypothetical protein
VHNEPPLPGVHALWQSQHAEGERVSAEDIRRKSERLQQTARRRTTAFYLMGAGNAGIPLALMWFLPELRLALGYLVVTAVVLVSYVRRRSAFLTLPPAAAHAQGLAFFRELLARERDFRRDSTRWFTIGPALNIIVLCAVYVRSSLFHGTAVELAVVGVVVATHAVLLARIVQRLRGEVRAFQRQIDALDGLTA